MQSTGNRLLVDLALLIALLGVVTSALLNWFLAGLAFFGELPDRDDYRTMTTGFGVAALLLLAGLLPVWALRAARWVGATAVLLALLCGVLARSTWQQAPPATPGDHSETWSAVAFLAWAPTSWPLLLLVSAAPWFARRRVRGSSSLTPR